MIRVVIDSKENFPKLFLFSVVVFLVQLLLQVITQIKFYAKYLSLTKIILLISCFLFFVKIFSFLLRLFITAMTYANRYYFQIRYFNFLKRSIYSKTEAAIFV